MGSDADGLVTTIAGSPLESGDQDGPAGEARFALPCGLALSSDGKRLLCADVQNKCVVCEAPSSLAIHPRTLTPLPLSFFKLRARNIVER
jgi:hypothetical protein